MKYHLANHRLCHDICWAWAAACVDRLAWLRPEERRELHAMFYEAAMAALHHYEQEVQRERRRLSPSKN